MGLDVVAALGADGLEPVQRFFDGVTTLEGRLLLSGILVVLTLLVALWIVPRILGVLGDRVGGPAVGGGVARTLEVAGRSVPTTGRELVVRTVQLVLLSVALVTLILVWDLGPALRTAFRSAGLSISTLTQLGVTLVLVLLAFLASDLLEDAIATFSKGADRLTEHQEEIFRRVGQLGIVVLVLATGLTVWGINLSGLLVGAGFLGIVVGLAARQTLGSLIAGLVLMFSRPFTIGDWVQVGEESGIVTEITIFNTRLETFDGEFVVLPNDTVSNSAITNRSRKGHLRIRVDVGIDYEADTDRAEAVAIEAIEDVDAVETAPPPQVIPKAFGDSAVVLEMRFWIDRPTPPRKWQATAAVVSSVKAALEDADIKIPFPQREVSGRAETGGFQVRGAEAPAEAVEPTDAASSDEPVDVDTGADGEAANGGSVEKNGEGDGANGNRAGSDEGDAEAEPEKSVEDRTEDEGAGDDGDGDEGAADNGAEDEASDDRAEADESSADRTED